MDDGLQNIGNTHLLGYSIVCTIYLIILFNRNKNIDNYHFYIFFFMSFFVQFLLNIYDIYTTDLCKSANDVNKITIIIMHTFIPWIFILGVGKGLLSIFPGWLRIFSNTIGMSFAYDMLYKKTIYDEINTPLAVKGDPNNQENISLLNKILSDPKKILNEIDITSIENDEELDKFYREKLNKISPELFRTEGSVMTKENIDKKIFTKTVTGQDGKEITLQMCNIEYYILQLLKYKNIIGQAIWYILFGLIAVLISTNSIINSKCDAF